MTTTQDDKLLMDTLAWRAQTLRDAPGLARKTKLEIADTLDEAAARIRSLSAEVEEANAVKDEALKGCRTWQKQLQHMTKQESIQRHCANNLTAERADTVEALKDLKREVEIARKKFVATLGVLNERERQLSEALELLERMLPWADDGIEWVEIDGGSVMAGENCVKDARAFLSRTKPQPKEKVDG